MRTFERIDTRLARILCRDDRIAQRWARGSDADIVREAGRLPGLEVPSGYWTAQTVDIVRGFAANYRMEVS